MKKATRRPSRHTFRFKIEVDGEKPRIHSVKAKVTRARKPVTLILTEADVERSMALKGVGNTQTCSMAVCAKRQADAFPHPVEGYIDWQYSSAYVVTKVSKENGMPSACVAYRHNDEIAQLNDSRDGQKKLLAKLRENGPRKIRLLPIVYKPREKGRPRGANDGSRQSRPHAVGAKARFAFDEPALDAALRWRLSR
jgi:hypothetical protein